LRCERRKRKRPRGQASRGRSLEPREIGEPTSRMKARSDHTRKGAAVMRKHGDERGAETTNVVAQWCARHAAFGVGEDLFHRRSILVVSQRRDARGANSPLEF